MNYSDFRSLVTHLRASQKRYFKERSNEALSEAKKYEHEVDRALAEYDEGQKRFDEIDESKLPW